MPVPLYRFGIAVVALLCAVAVWWSRAPGAAPSSGSGSGPAGNGCRDVYLDLGTNLGVQIRKLYEPERYKAMLNNLLQRDPYLLMADFASYVRTQLEVDALFANRTAWAERALRNIAGMGPFSVDRTIGQYIEQVWVAPSR